MTEPFKYETSLRKIQLLRGYLISLDELIALYQLLQQQSDAAAEIEVSSYTLLEDQTEEELEATKQTARSLYRVFVRLEAGAGETISEGEGTQVLVPHQLTKNISRIGFDSGYYYENHAGRRPRNRVTVVLDFRSTPAKLPGYLPNNETPNESQFVAEGENTEWVRSTQSALNDFFVPLQKKGTWIHNQGNYDNVLHTIGVVFIAWTLAFFVPKIDGWFIDAHNIYRFASYIFVFIFSLRFFAGMFNYARWIWPLAEISDNNNQTKTHRAIWIAMAVSIVSGLIYDVFVKIN